MSFNRVQDLRQSPAQRLRRAPGADPRWADQQLTRDHRLARDLQRLRGDDDAVVAYLRMLPRADLWVARIIAVRELGAGAARAAFVRIGVEAPLPEVQRRSLREELRDTFGDEALDVAMERDSGEADGAEAATRGGRV